MSLSITELMYQAKPRGLTVQKLFFFGLCLFSKVLVGKQYFFGTGIQFLPLPLDVTSLWNLVEVLPLCNEEVGQLGTG